MSNAIPIKKETVYKNNLVTFPEQKKELKLKLDGTPKLTPCNSVEGKPHEVYPLRTEEEINIMVNYFKNKMEQARNKEDKQIAGRNLMMFVVGINLGLRASDLLKLTWEDVFDKDREFKDGIRKQEKKTSKYKTFFLNNACKNAINNYIEEFKPLIKPDLPIFASREGGTIEVQTAYKVLKKAAEACNIKQNVGSHTMRKTFADWFLMTHSNDVMALSHLQDLLNHSSQIATLRYAGLVDEQNKLYYNDLNLGMSEN